MELLPYQKRVVEEQSQLLSKAGLLKAWLASREPQHLTVEERCIMELQLSIMELYAEVLGRRIAIFKGESNATSKI